MRFLVSLTIIPLVAACGRLGFRDAPAPDAEPADAPPPDRLTCGAPARFAIPATTARLAAAPTAHGYQLFTIDNLGDVHGQAYEFTAGALVARVTDAPVGADATGVLDATPVGDGALLVMPYGRPSATGTTVIPLDGKLEPRGAAQQLEGWFGGPGAIATSSTGAIAMLGTLTTGEVDVKLVSPLGVELAAQRPVVSKADAATQPTIVAGATGYVVTWSANAASPNEVRAELLDAQLAVTDPAVPISAAATEAFLPRVAYAAGRDTYLFAWTEKAGGSGDVIGLSLRDGKLGATRGAVRFAPKGANPRIVAGTDDFLVVWDDFVQPSRLDAARITADGVVTPMPITGTGAKAVTWDVVVRGGQPALIWVEGDAAGANVWLDPVCR